MKTASLLTFLLALFLLAFGYIGYFTQYGKNRFDEMDGMYPFFALVAGGFLMVLSLIFFLMHRLKK